MDAPFRLEAGFAARARSFTPGYPMPQPRPGARSLARALVLSLISIIGLTVAGTAVANAATGARSHRARAAMVRPVLTLRGRSLHWSRVHGVSRYVIAIVPRGKPASYRVVRGVTFTPRLAPRETVGFRVRADIRRAPWTRRVWIAFGQVNGARHGADHGGQPAGTQYTGKLKVGVMDLGNYNYAPFSSASLFSHAGITYTREDVDRGQNTGTCASNDYVCTALRNGIAPMVLFEGYADRNMTTEVVSLAQKLQKLAATYPIMNNMHVIEFGNEVWWGTSGPAEDAATYGRQYNAAHQALAQAGLSSWKLLADGDALGKCVNSYTSPNWIDQVIGAQADGAAGVDGWTVHPYGPMTTDHGCGATGQGYGWPEVVNYHNIAVAAGSTAPWYVTEVGQCLGGPGCNDPVPMGSASDLPEQGGSAPYFTQAADIRQYLTDAGGDVRTGTAAKYPWIAALIFYQAYDDGSGEWGLLSNGTNFGQPADFERPAFSELTQWVAANGEG
jgi:hypothetical protein